MDTLRLLLVEDNEDQATLINRALSRHDRRFKVAVVESGEACLTALAEAEFALVLLDYRLPRTNGLDVLRELRQAGHQMPVIMMTAYGDEAVAVEAMKAGAVDYIVKRAGYLTQLGLTISQVLQRHRLEAELALSRRRYQTLFEFSRDAIFILDSTGRIVDSNATAETLLNVPCEELVGRYVFDLIRPDHPEQEALWRQRLGSQKGSFNIAFSFVDQQGRCRSMEVDAVWLEQALEINQPGYFQLFVRDVTEARRDQAVWDALGRAALAAHNQLESEQIFRAVADILLELGLSSSMWWLDEEKKAIQVRYTTYVQDLKDQFAERTGLDVENWWVPVDHLTIFRDGTMNGETVYLDDGARLVRQLVSIDEAEVVDWVVDRFGLDSALMLPFEISGQVKGVLLIHGDLSERDVPAARAFAMQVSSALEHARLFGETQRSNAELAILNTIASATSQSLDLDVILNETLGQLVELLDVEAGWIMLVRPDETQVDLHAHYGLSSSVQSKLASVEFRGVPLADVTPQLGGPLVIDDIALCPELVQLVMKVDHLQSYISVPLEAKDAFIGTISLFSRERQRLREDDLGLLHSVGRQIGVAIENARLYGDVQRRILELAALQEISFKLSSALEIGPLLEAITDIALKITDAYNCHIYLLSEEGFDFAAARRRDGSSEPMVSQPRSDGLVARVAQLADPLLIDDAEHHPLYQTPEARLWGIQAIAGYPLLRSGQVLGVFTLTYLKPHRFDQAEKHILSLLADQAAAAVETARLYESSRRRNEDLATLYQVALAVGAQLNISDVLDVACEAVSRATSAEIFAVGLYDETTDELAYKMIREEGKLISHPSMPVTSGQGLTTWVARNRQELIVGDLQSEPSPVPGVLVGVPVRSWMGFPLMVGDQLVGVMSVQSHRPGAFDMGHQRLCRGIATHVAIALEKARLVEEVRQHNWELSVLNRVSATVSHSFDLETLLDGALSILLDEMRLEAGVFHLLDAKDNLLTLVSQKNLPPEAVRDLLSIVPGVGFLSQVLLSGEPIVVDSYHQDSRRLSERLADYDCFAVVPLSSQDRPVGTLSVLDRGSRQLTTGEVNLLSAIGRQIGVAVDNTLLYWQTRDRERRLRRLHEAARSLSSVLESRKLLRRVLEVAVGELQASGALLWLYDDAKGLYPHLALGTLAGQERKSDPDTRLEMEQVLRGKEGVLWANRESPQQWSETEIADKRGYRAAVPLRGQAGEIGVLEIITASEKDRLTSDDVDFMSTLGGIAAIAHENAQLYEALARYATSLETKVQERTAEIRREKEQTDVILRSVADGVFVVDHQSRIVLTNAAADGLLNIPEQSDRLREYIHMVAQQLDNAAPGPTITLDGQTLQARAAKIRQDEGELGTVIILRDVTHFEEVNRLKSEFVRTVSHELRTPLSNLKLYLPLLERGRAEKKAEYQLVLMQEVNRLENLIQDLLDLSSLEAREGAVVAERLNLWEVVSYVATVLAPKAEDKQIDLTSACEVDEAGLWVQANRDQMVQLVINLTANAINYTEPHGEVTLNLRGKADRSAGPQGRWVVLAVQDTGVGIPPDELPRIWDRFFRGRVQRHMSAGTGLGLAIVKEILNRYGGWITVESKEGVGSLFTVGLPGAPPPEGGE